MARGDREESVSPRRRYNSNNTNNNNRNTSISPSRRMKNNNNNNDRTRLDLSLLNVTGDSIMPKRDVNRPAGRSRTTTRASSRIRGASSPSRSRRGRTLSTAARERQDAIDRENRILLRKILEQHHGLRRGNTANSINSIPSAKSCRSYSPRRSRSSRQINEQKLRNKTDYENLLLLQKIQNVRPSRQIATSFARVAY